MLAQNEALPRAGAQNESGSQFDAPPDPCIAVVGCARDLCERDVIISKVGEIIEGTRAKPGYFKVLTKGVRNGFQIKFVTPEPACIFRDYMQHDDGEWKRVAVSTPTETQVPRLAARGEKNFRCLLGPWAISLLVSCPMLHVSSRTVAKRLKKRATIQWTS